MSDTDFIPSYREEHRGYKSPCWVWSGKCWAKGYGKVSGYRYSTQYAHRLMWTLAHGPVPAGFELDHLCRVRECVRPDHLEAVSHTLNMRRSANRKLTVEQVREILSSDASNPELARKFGVSRKAIYAVRTRENWKVVEIDETHYARIG